MQLWSKTKHDSSLRALIALSTLFALLFGDIETVLAQTSLFDKQVNYQAKLMTPAGVAVPDGAYNLWFRLYLTPAGATTSNIWEEQYVAANKVQVQNGLLSVMLGSVNSLAGVNWNQPLYLGVEVGGSTTPAWDGEMSPRKILGAVPAAFTAETLAGLTSNQFVRSDATSTIATSSAQTLLTINQQGSGNILDLKSSGVTLASFLANGNVGIGTTTPGQLLDIQKSQNADTAIALTNAGTGVGSRSIFKIGEDANLTPGSQSMGFGYDNNSYNKGAGYELLPANAGFLYAGTGATNGLSILTAANAPIVFGTGGWATANERMRITGSGNVGIASSSPSQLFGFSVGTTTYLAGGTTTAANGVNILSGCFSIGGTCLSTGGSASSTLLADNNSWSGTNIFNNILRSTSTQSTTTNLFANTLFALGGTFTTFTATGTGVANQSSFQNYTAVNATDTNATSTNSFFANILAAVTGRFTSISATSTSATSTFAAAITVGAGQGTSTFGGGLSANVLSILSTTASSTFGNGINLVNGCLSYNGSACLTQGLTSAITSVGPTGALQTGPAITFATSSTAYQGLTASTTITASGNQITFANTMAGVLTAGGGGTGISNPSVAGILLGSYAGGAYQQLATSSLGLLTNNVAEGSNLYFTPLRADARVNATDTLGTLLYLPNLVRSTTTAATTTNLYTTNFFGAGLSTCATALTYNSGAFGCNAALTGASSTLLTDNNTFSGTNQFNKFTFTNATGTNSTTTNSSYALIHTGSFGIFNSIQSTSTSATSTFGAAITVGAGQGTSTFGGGLSANVLSILSTTASSTFGNGINLVNGCLSYNGSACLTQGLTSAITSVGPTGALQTGPAITFATSSTAYQGLTASTTITASGNQITFANTMAGVLTAGGGGTGISNPSVAGILLGSYAGGAYQQLATSSLGLLTNNVAEGTNLYFTPLRADARVNATDTLGTLLYLPNLVRSTTTAATTTNLYTTNFFGAGLSTCATALTYNSGAFGCNAALTGASSTLLTDNNTFSGTNQFNKFTFTNATGTNSTTTNSSYALIHTGSFGIFNSIQSTSTSATSTFGAAITVGAGQGTSTFGGAISATQLSLSGAATNTAANGFNLTNGCFSIGGTCLSSGAASAGIAGAIQFSNGSGAFSADATNFFWDNTNKRLGIGTSSPYAKLAVKGVAGEIPFAVSSSTNDNLFSINQRGTATFGTTSSANIFINGGGTSSNPFLITDNVAIGNSALTYTTTGANHNIALGSLALLGSSTIPMTGSDNFAGGYEALANNTSGTYNNALGYFALLNNTIGQSNNALGHFALLANQSGGNNNALGDSALFQNITGSDNNALGSQVLYQNKSGSYNNALGNQAMFYNVSGSNNIASGYLSLYRATSTSNNIALGSSAMYGSSTALSISGANNFAAGFQALFAYSSGANNTAIGYQSLYSNDTGSNNTAIGYWALKANTTGTENAAIGYDALLNNTSGIQNIANGSLALVANTTGSGNTALGAYALRSNTTGGNNFAVGNSALSSATSTNNNIAIGFQAMFGSTTALSITGTNNEAMGNGALYSNINGNDNAAIGAFSLYTNTDGYNNIAVGNSTLYYNTTGNDNLALGSNALAYNTSGAFNIANGYNALNTNVSGVGNIAIGARALESETAGSYNIASGWFALRYATTSYNNAIGYQAGIGDGTTQDQRSVGDTFTNFFGYQASRDASIASTTALTNITAIGKNARVGQSNSIVLGGTGTDAVNVGIGTSSPYARLSVVGQVVGAFFTGTTTATSTFGGNIAINGLGTSTSAGGINLSAGCFSINGTCLSLGGGASSTLLTDNNTFSGTNIFGNILRSTTTQATSTSLFSTVLSALGGTISTLTNTNLTGSTATITSATTTNLFAQNASTTNATSSYGFFSNQLTAVNGKFTGAIVIPVTSCAGGQALNTDSSGNVVCGTVTTGGSSVGGGWTTNNVGAVTLATTSDRVGIGATTTSYAKLSVISGSTATTTFALLPASGQTANIIDIYNTSGVLSSVLTAGGSLGIATTSPSATLEVGGTGFFSGLATLFGGLFAPNATITNSTSTNLFATNLVATGATTTALNVSGNSTTSFGGGVSTPLLAVTGVSTSTFNNGISLTNGCFSVGGTCLSSNSSSGISGAIQFSNGSGAFNADASQLFFDNTNKALALGTSTAYAKLSLQGAYGSQQPLFDIASSTNANGSATSSLFTILANGNVGIGTATPGQILDIQKNQNADTVISLINAGTGVGSRSYLKIGEDANSKSMGFGYNNNSYNLGAGYELLPANAGFLYAGSSAINGLSVLTTTNAPIIFGTGGFAAANERMRITGSGNVAIASSSPSQLFGFSVGTTTYLAGGTTTAANGVNLLSGCFAVAGTCLPATGASSTLLTDNNTFSGTNQFNKFTFTNATGTNSTTTNSSYALIHTGSFGIFNSIQSTSTSATSTFGAAITVGAGQGTSTFGGGLSANVLSILSTTASSTFGNGINLVNGCLSYNGSACLTQGLTSAITSVGPTGALQTGPAITFATSSTAYQGLTASTTITASGNQITFANTMAGVLTAGGGGTGISNPSVAGILLGSYAGGAYQQLATSSLGLLTNNVAEGTNLYFTPLRADARVNATDTLGTLLYLPNLVRSTTTAATTTNLYTTNFFGAGLSTCATALTYNSGAFGCNAALTGASSTLLTDNNTFSGTNQFNKFTFTNATGTNSTTTNSSYALIHTGSFGIFNSIQSTSTSATSTFAAAITVGAGQGTSTFGGGLSATQLSLSGAATNTAANGFNLTAGCFSIGGTCLTSGTSASSTLFADTNTFSGQNIFSNILRSTTTQATSTNFFANVLFGVLGTFGNIISTSSATSTFAGAITVGAGQGTSTFGGGLSASALNITSTNATSTFGNGITLSGGCFRDTNATSTCIGRGQSATYVVAASNSKGKAYADFVGSGTGDQAAINAAINAAYSASRGKGGKVYLLEGDYSINAATTMATGTMLIGSGQGTVIKLANSVNTALNIIDATNVNNITVADLFIDGNKANNAGLQNGISFTSVSTSTIRNIIASGTNQYGITLNTSNNNLVAGNIANLNATYGILLLNSSYNIVSGNISNTNSNSGIYVSGGTNNFITENAANGNTQFGISLQSSSYDNLSLNSANGNGSYGVYLVTASNNALSGNTINSNSIFGAFLQTSSNNNTLTGNSFYDNGASGANDSINIASSNNNIISSNQIIDTAGSGFAINITSGVSVGNVIIGNFYSGTGATSIRDNGTDTKYTEWDRLTLDTKSLGSVAYSPLSIFASSSVALASTTQMGTGKIMSLNNATSGEVFTIANNGSVGIGSSSPSAQFGLSMSNPLYVSSTTASSTFANGINLQAGCFSIGGTCLSSGGGSSVGISGAIQFSNGSGGFSADATKFFFDNTQKALALGTSTAYAKLSLQGAYGSQQVLFDIASSTNTSGSATTSLFTVLANGNVGIATSSPQATLDVSGSIRGNAFVLTSSSTAYSTLSSFGGFNGYVNSSGGLGTGGNDSVSSAQRLTAYGNLTNIGSIQAGELALSSGGTFAAKVDYTTGTGAAGVAIGDVNGDGKADLAVPNYNAGSGTTVSVLLNNGDGTFAAKQDYTVGTAPASVAIGDVNGDGKADLVVANYNSASISVLLNNGNGTFAPKIDYTTGSSPNAVAIGDVNGDGKVDLATANYNSTSVSVFINSGNGTFAAKQDYTTGAHPYNVAIGDVNGDGKADLVLPDSTANTVSVLFNNGNGTFAAKQDYTTGLGPNNVIIGDLNGDGKADLATANYTASSISVFINNGSGTFAAKQDYNTGTNPNSIAIGDVNGDGKADLATANYNGASVSVLINTGSGTFPNRVDYTGNANPFTVAIGDVNGDGKADVAVANYGGGTGNTVSVFINNPTQALYVQGSSGNVSLGTTSPFAKFSIQSTYGSQLVLIDVSTTTAVNGTATSSLFRINANGNVGIGTSSPYAKLAVVGEVVAAFFTATSTTGNSTFQGNLGIATTSPWARLSVELDTSNPALVVANNSSTSPALYIGGVNQNGFIGLGTTTNISLARMTIDNSVSQNGSTYAIGGLNEMYTFNPSVANTLQVGDRFIGINAPTSATNTAIGKIVRMIDNSSLSNLVRGIEVSAAAGNNTWGVNTGLRATGHTYGVQALTTGLAGGSSTPAALYGENTGTTQGDILRLYTSTMTTATSVAQFYQEISAYSGAGLYMDFGNGGGTFTGNFLDLRVNGNQRFVVSAAGTTTIGQPNQTTNQAGLQIGYGGLCVDNDGLCNASTTGRVSAVSYTTGSTDLAENYYATETLEAGDIVTTRGKYLIGRAASSTHAVLGIISTKPGVILGEGEKPLEDLPAYPVALSGRVPVKVSDESGTIHVGDHVVLSSLDGIGMAESSSTQFGRPTVGIALEEFDGTHYLSEATIDTMTTRVATGTPLCTTKTSVNVEKNAGGKDVEGGIGTAYGASATVTNTDCKQEMVDVVPNSGSALSSSTATREVKIGKIVVFVEHGASTQNYATPGLSWETGADGTSTMKFWESLDVNGNKIFNLGRIEGVNGNWWIDENGEMHAERIVARDIEATEKLNVGSATHPSGITIFDKDTNLPYCLVMASGALITNAGSCDSLSGTLNVTPSTSTTAPNTSTTSMAGTSTTTPALETTQTTGTTTTDTTGSVAPPPPPPGDGTTTSGTASSTSSTP